MRFLKLVLIILSVLVLIVVAAVAALVFVDPSVFRNQLETRASAAFGREFIVEGPIGLAGEKRGDLDHVEDLGGGVGLVGQVDIAADGHADMLADLGEDGQALFEARPAEAADAGAVGLVEARFEDVADTELLCDGL